MSKSDMTRVLFLCTGNSARSQMAEAILRGLDPTLDVRSAGTRPAAAVHPAAVRALAEMGLDAPAARPKSVDTFLDQAFDFVVTVCGNADQACPVFRGTVGRRLHIGFEDPAAAAGTGEEILAVFRDVRDRIRRRLAAFWAAEIASERPAGPADLEPVRSLLAACGLPVDGLGEQFGEGYSVIEAAGRVAACAGVERYGAYGLLRSVGVDPEWRGYGWGARLTRSRIEWARRSGLEALYLLTTTASAFFARAGFETTARDTAPAGIRLSREFAHACPDAAILMRLLLAGR